MMTRKPRGTNLMARSSPLPAVSALLFLYLTLPYLSPLPTGPYGRHRALRAPNTSPHKTENAAEHHRSSAPYAAPHAGSGGPLSQPAGQRASHWSLSRPATLPTLQTPPPRRFRASAGARLAAAPSTRSRREPCPPLARCSTGTHTHTLIHLSRADHPTLPQRPHEVPRRRALLSRGDPSARHRRRSARYVHACPHARGAAYRWTEHLDTSSGMAHHERILFGRSQRRGSRHA